MRVLAGLISVDEGKIIVENDDLHSTDLKTIRNGIGYLPQDFDLYPKATVYDCLNHIAL